MTKDEALMDLLEAVDLAIYSGDWRVDGACDPDVAIQRAREVLAQPEQELVQWGVDWGRAGETPCVSIIKRTPNGGIEVVAVEYGPPPQRTWAGLTEEQIKECFQITPDQYLPWHIYQRIEAKLKEENT
jgi:hypothetical protein